jgi:hypothetical protein
MTKRQREQARKSCAECDRHADATTVTPDGITNRCTAHWVAYYRRQSGSLAHDASPAAVQ